MQKGDAHVVPLAWDVVDHRNIGSLQLRDGRVDVGDAQSEVVYARTFVG